jgi:sugar phosphate isomerase/epimerase
MRIGITYLYTIFRYGYPHTVEDAFRSVEEVRGLGFRYLEMEGLGPEHLRALYAERERLLALLARQGLHVHNFCVVDPDLVSLDERRRARAYENFRMGAELAAMLGAGTLHLASYAPPVAYPDAKPYGLGAEGGYRFADVPRLSLPEDFDWDRVWNALVESCRACAAIAAGYGKTVIMEPRVGEVICSVDSLLRLIEHTGCANFQANFDTGHFSAHRENVTLALAKLKGKFANIHISDNNPANTAHLAIGDGAIDWQEFFRTLGRMGYDGYLGLDLGLTDNLVEAYRSSVARIQEIAGRLNLRVEV